MDMFGCWGVSKIGKASATYFIGPVAARTQKLQNPLIFGKKQV